MKVHGFVEFNGEFVMVVDNGCNVVYLAEDLREFGFPYLIWSKKEVEGYVKDMQDRPPRIERVRKFWEECAAHLESWPVPHPDPESVY